MADGFSCVHFDHYLSGSEQERVCKLTNHTLYPWPWLKATRKGLKGFHLWIPRQQPYKPLMKRPSVAPSHCSELNCQDARSRFSYPIGLTVLSGTTKSAPFQIDYRMPAYAL